MRDMKYLYAYKHKQTGNVILTRSVIVSKDWDMIEDHTNPADSDPERESHEGAKPDSEEYQTPDTAPAEKPAAAPAAAKNKAPTAAKKSTGKKV